MLFDDLLHNAEAQPGTISSGGKEGIEDVWQVSRRNPMSAIAHRDSYDLPTVFARSSLGSHTDTATLLCCRDTIEQQVDECLMQQLRITFDQGQLLLDMAIQHNMLLARIRTGQCNCALDYRFNIDRATLKWEWPRVAEQLLHQTINPINLSLDDLGIFAMARMFAQLTVQHLCSSAGDPERISDLMGQPTCEPAQCGQALRPLNLLFKCPLFSKIVENQHSSDLLALCSNER